MEYLAFDPTDPGTMLRSFGLIGVYTILFVETGLLVGFFLPGDGLLLLAGIVSAGAAGGGELAGVDLPLPALLIGAPIAAIAGSQVGYLIGRLTGNRLEHGRHQDRLDRGAQYLERYGVIKALLLARFVGVIRTVINPAAGMLRVPGWKFFTWNAIGAIIWTDGIILIGYLFGNALPFDFEAAITPIVLIVMIASTTPAILAYIRRPRVSLPTVRQDARSAELNEAVLADDGPPAMRLSQAETEAGAHILAQVEANYPDGPTRTLARELARRLRERESVNR